jgi:hypothetical protein
MATGKRKTVGVKLTLRAIKKLSNAKTNLRAREIDATLESIIEHLVLSLDEDELAEHLRDRKSLPRGRGAKPLRKGPTR